MYEAIAMRRLERTVLIHRIVQLLLVALLVYMALHFQEVFRARGEPQVFRNSLLATLLVQLALFLPIRRFAGNEAGRELAAAAVAANAPEQKPLRQQRLVSDTIKGAVFLGYTAFILMAPPATFVLATTFFCFIVTVITYLQCFTFAVRRGLTKSVAS